MAIRTVTDDEFLAAVDSSQTWDEVAQRTGLTIRPVYQRRREIEGKRGIYLLPGDNKDWHPRTCQLTFTNPIDAILYGDSHIWPEIYKTEAFYALCILAAEKHPTLCVDMGDSLDGARITRHARRGWHKTPTVQEELEANTEFRSTLESNLPKSCKKIWIPGNHDIRFPGRLSNVSPEYEGVKGTELSDHFPGWQFNASVTINDELFLTHRFKGGDHAAFNNVLRNGVSTGSGHLHRCLVRPVHNLRGLHFGIETGTLADIYGPQFEYTETNNVDWHHGFIWLHIDGTRLWPEPVWIRGKVFRLHGRTYHIEDYFHVDS